MGKLNIGNFNPLAGGVPSKKKKPLYEIMFDKYDTDDSKAIDYNEFQGLCTKLGYYLTPDELKVAVKTIDSDGSGEIELNEFAKWWKSENRFKKLQLSEDELKLRQECISVFEDFDKDGDGTIDTKEFKKFYKMLKKAKLTIDTTGKNLTCDQMLKDLDADGDGAVSFAEYMNYIIKFNAGKIKVIHA